MQRNDTSFFGCNRPPNREPEISIALLHPVFGKFKDDSKRATPTAEDYRCVRGLRECMLQFFDDEGIRRSKLLDILDDYGIGAQPGPIGSTSRTTDGHIVSNIHPRLIIEVKNDIGWKGAEPSLQALAYYDSFCRERKLWDDISSCHPCFIVCVAGKSHYYFCS